MTAVPKIGFFDTILANSRKHPNERCSWLGRLVQWYFDFGQNAYKIDYRTLLNNDAIPVFKEIHKQNGFILTLKVFFLGLTTLSIVFPIIMLTCLKIYKSKNKFELLKIPSFKLLSTSEESFSNPLKQSPSSRKTKKNHRNQNNESLNLIFSDKNVLKRIEDLQKKFEQLHSDSLNLFNITIHIDILSQKKVLEEYIRRYKKQKDIPEYLRQSLQALENFSLMVTEFIINDLESEKSSLLKELHLLEVQVKEYYNVNEIPEEILTNYVKSIEIIQDVLKKKNKKLDCFDKEIYKLILKEMAPKGIPNILNSCYMNSGLQLLIGIPFFRDMIRSKEWKPRILDVKLENEEEDAKHKRTEKDLEIFEKTATQYKSVHLNFQKFVEAYHEGRALAEYAKRLRDSLYKAKVIEEGKKSQQDADIFFRTLVSSSGYSIMSRRRVFSHKENNIKERKFPIDYSQPYFTISMKEFKEKNVFSLSFQNLIDREFSEKPLDVDDPYIGEGYDTESYKYEEAPEYLILLMKRFGNDQQKYNDKLIFENGEYIDFTSAMSSDVLRNSEEKNFLYEPIGLIRHEGESYRYGHYTSDVKINGLWFTCNDESVKKVGLNNSNLGNGYIYCFKKVKVNA